MKIQLRQLEAFRKVSQTGSFTRAAESLGISQPAISRLISSFSKNVGFQVFERRNGQLFPTQESRFLLKEVERLFESLEHVTDLTQDLTERKAGHLRIACLPGFATSHMPGVLARFLENRPDVKITLEPDRPERILEWIIGEQYDCGITDGFTEHPAIEVEKLSIRTVCIMADGNPLAMNDVITPADLAREPIIHTRKDSVFFRELSKVFSKNHVELNSWIETRQFTAACMLVAEGTGVSIVSELDAYNHLDRGIIMRPFSPNVPHELSLVRPIHSSASMLTLEFLDFFARSLKQFEFRADQT